MIVIVTLSILSGMWISRIMDRMDRASHPQQYAEFVSKYSEEYGVPEYIIYAVIKTESDFDSAAMSEDGAIGLMQLMPDTFSWLTEIQDESYETGMLYDPETNIRYGTYYLSYLYGLYARWPTAYAAYNAGPNNVDEWLTDGRYSKDGMSLYNIPFPETEDFVSSVEKSAKLYEELYYKDRSDNYAQTGQGSDRPGKNTGGN